MSLPLLDRSTPHNPRFRLFTGEPPAYPPPAGEQFRFHFDMTRCIGCKCCEVACNEQNGNPTDINWRRVGEIEGGTYPFTQRFHLSMGCNHCVDAACLNGCPVEAYTKDPTGIVLHSAEVCIGCQYCTWNCPYGVPQYNPERGVVGKCDMCHGRLAEGRSPACVSACPENAIEIETVNLADWIRDHHAANSPGMPPAEQTISTTRITLPEKLEPSMTRGDYHRVRPEHPHWPLVFMTVLTQLCAGAYIVFALLGTHQRIPLAAAFAVLNMGLGFSTLHLGRPAHAVRAVKMWKRSWLSREVLLFSLFAAAAAPLILFPSRPLAILTALFGVAGVTASAYIYLVPARPAWNLWNTLFDFQCTGLFLGALFTRALGVKVPAVAVGVLGGLIMLNELVKLYRLRASDEFEMVASSRLILADLRIFAHARFLLGLAAILLVRWPEAALVAGLAAQLFSRYLFFVSVVGRNMAATFFHREAA